MLKPSEQTPLSLLRFAELAQDVLPAGVLNVVTGDGVPVGERIVTHPDVRLVSLTGDVETGKTIARTAADTLKRVHLELGGKAPVIVFDDADPAAVAEGIKIGGYWNSGQDCTAASRVVAGPKIYERLLEELVPAVESLAVGDPAGGAEIDMGPVISKSQQERVFGFLERAQGATVLIGGDAGSDRGFFVQPTIVTDVGQGDEIVQREVFGPVVTVQRFADDARGDRVGERRQLRPRRLGLDTGRGPGAQRGAGAPVRNGLDQRPHPAGLGDAARRLQAVGVREGSLHLLARGLHADQARDGEARLIVARALIFDLDGTLVDTVYAHVFAWQRALAEEGMPIDGWRIHRRIGMSGGLFARAVAREVGRDLSPDEVEALQQHHGRIFRELLPERRPLPGAVQLLADLRAAGVLHGIATSGRRPEIDRSLEALGIPADTVVIERGDVARAKPEPDLFLACAAGLGVEPDDCYVVGDAVWDLLAARRAGMLSVGLLSGGYGADELLASGAFRVYDDPAELHSSLDELGIAL